MASHPKDEHCFILDSFKEFEALARRALHEGQYRLFLLFPNNPTSLLKTCLRARTFPRPWNPALTYAGGSSSSITAAAAAAPPMPPARAGPTPATSPASALRDITGTGRGKAAQVEFS